MPGANITPRTQPRVVSWVGAQRPIRIFNTTDEKIPPGSCVQIAQLTNKGKLDVTQGEDAYWAAVARSGEPMLAVKRPDSKAADEDPSRYLFTGLDVILPKSPGVAYSDFPLVAASVCTDRKNHSTLGPQSGKWYIGPGKCWKLISHDPTESIGYVGSDNKWVSGVLIQPFYFRKVLSSSFARFYLGGGAANEVDAYGAPTLPGEFAEIYGGAEDIEITITGEYEFAMYARLWVDLAEGEVPVYPIVVEVVKFARDEEITADGGEVVFQIELDETRAATNNADYTNRDYFVGNCTNRESGIDLEIGDVLKVRNASIYPVRIGGWPTFIDGVGDWVGAPPTWTWGWNNWYSGIPGFWGGWTGWYGGWGAWNGGLYSQAELRVVFIAEPAFTEDAGVTRAECKPFTGEDEEVPVGDYPETSPELPPSTPDTSGDCIYSWDGAAWNLYSQGSCVGACAPPSGSGSYVGQLLAGACADGGGEELP